MPPPESSVPLSTAPVLGPNESPRLQGASASPPGLHPAVIGVEKIVVASKYRRQGLATLLIDSIRMHEDEWERPVPMEQVAFSEPLEEGCRLATKLCGTAEFLTY